MMKLLICFILFFPVVLQAQDLAIISGKVTDSDNKPVFLANVTIPGTRYGTVTRENGEYELTIPADTEVTLVFSCVGFKQIEEKLLLNPGEHMIINKMLEIEIRSLEEVSISEEADRTTTITRIDTRTLDHLPSVSGSVEAIIATLPGVVSTSELSSQYSVRGGNFDENLVYVNDIEIHRPFLIRSGQQEGMSFINSDMVSSIRFSAGGFEAMYGDKMSSVLDIQYRRPSAFGGSTSLSLLGGSLQLEGTSKNQRFTYNSGFRYKTTKYLLQSFETKRT